MPHPPPDAQMPLPPVIEIQPLTAPVEALVTVPGSKSLTNRALILAALADGEVRLQGALWSEDTRIMAEALRVLGFRIDVLADPAESCNRHLIVQGLGGRIPNAGTRDNPLSLFVGNAGTAARFLLALCCLGSGSYRLHGVSRMHERPQSALFRALRELGYEVESSGGHLPATVHGRGPREGSVCRLSIQESSQFASALLLLASRAGWGVRLEGECAADSPYVAMTRRLLEVFPRRDGIFHVEPDASSGSYFWAAGWLAGSREDGRFDRPLPVTVSSWPTSGWQVDARFPEFLPLPDSISRERQLGDSIMTAIVLAADLGAAGAAGGLGRSAGVLFTDLGRLRVQECERVTALRTELTKCGGRVVEQGDTLTVYPGSLHGAEIETYEDHRMAMCFAILGLKVPGIRIQNPGCVRKTFPNFFQKLAQPPPHGLGATLLDGARGERLGVEALHAG